MVIVPPQTKMGDHICLIVGVEMPMLLREDIRRTGGRRSINLSEPAIFMGLWMGLWTGLWTGLWMGLWMGFMFQCTMYGCCHHINLMQYSY
jgi:hypothetical protein